MPCAIDSHEFEGEDDDAAMAEKMVTEETATEKGPEETCPEETLAKESDVAAAKPPEKQEYNPLIVRRSQRAIKPTKDIDLYLLGAQYGVDVEGSDADSSDLEFAPEAVSDGVCKCVYRWELTMYCYVVFSVGSDMSSDSSVMEKEATTNNNASKGTLCWYGGQLESVIFRFSGFR